MAIMRCSRLISAAARQAGWCAVQVEGFSLRGNDIVLARSTLKTPADLFRLGTSGGKETPITRLNAARVADANVGDFEFYTFKGADNATVQGYVVKPVGYEKGKRYPVAFIIHGARRAR